MLHPARYPVHLALSLILPVASLGLCQQVCAQHSPAETGPSETLSIETIKTRLKQLEELKDIEEGTKSKAIELYQQATEQLESSQKLPSAISQFESQAAQAADKTAAAKQERAGLPEKSAATAVPVGPGLSQLEQELSKKEQTLKEKTETLARLEAEPKRRAARLAEIPKLLKAAQQQLEEVDAELAANPPAGQPAPLTLASRTLSLVRRRFLALSITSLEKERVAYEATDELVEIERDIAARQLAVAEQEAKTWRDEVNRRRKADAEEQALQAQREAFRAIPAVAELAKKNSALALERKELADKIAVASRQLERARKDLNDIRTEFERTKEKVEAVGLSHASGQLLRQQRASLADVRQHRHDMQQRETTLGEVRFTIYQYQDRRSDLANLDQPTQRVIDQLPVEPTEHLQSAVHETLETEREYLDGLINDYRPYQSILLELNAVQDELINTAEEYAHYIDGRVLWIRSTFALSHRDIVPGVDALRWLGSPEGWRGMGTQLVGDSLRHAHIVLLFMAVFFPLVYLGRRFRREIARLGQSAARRGFSRFAPTLQSLLYTLVVSLIWPGVLGYLAWRLHGSLSATEFARAVASGLAATAAVYFPLELRRHTCRPGGLGEAHFGWPPPSLRLVRRHVRWLLVLGLPLVFIAKTTDSQSTEPLWSTSLGRVAFIVFLILFSLFFRQILHPSRGALKHVLAYGRGGWLHRMRYVWYPLVTAAPLSLAVLAGIGFYATSQMLAERLSQTLWLALGLAMLGGILSRWVLVIRRQLAMEQARQRREAAQTGPSASSDPASPTTSPNPEQAESDLATISSQTQQLIRTVLLVAGILLAWLIWADIVPALAVLKTVPVWPGARALTILDVLAAVVILTVTHAAAKNVPGLLEFTVLQNLPLDTGARYAVTTLCRYLLVLIGVAAAGQSLGITWSSIQWLIAAVGIGLGFGLQEIFANFVSGIILLFERPIRVGDVVTLGDTTGVVTRIRMRATTISDWDLKEFVVPNKDLVTGRLLNWTLSDHTNRIVIPVGVAYGTDTDRASELLLKVARHHPFLLDDPAPTATFEGFGDSTLNMVLRCFLPNLENRLSTIHELHTAIDKAFREAGIEIAYPQRDLHIRSIDQPLRTVERHILQGASAN